MDPAPRMRNTDLPPGLEEIGSQVLDAAFEVHRELGPGLLESAYQECLAYELRVRGLEVETEVSAPLRYKGVRMDVGYRMDVVVNRSVIIELKAVEEIHPIHEAQLLTYLKLTGARLGFILNFKAPLMKDGLRRFVR